MQLPADRRLLGDLDHGRPEVRDLVGAEETEGELDLGLEDTDGVLEESTADTDTVRAEAESLNDLSTAGDTAVDENVELALLFARSVGGSQALGMLKSLLRETGGGTELRTEELGGVLADLKEDVKRGTGGVELASTVVRDNDTVAAGLVGHKGVLDCLNTWKSANVRRN